MTEKSLPWISVIADVVSAVASVMTVIITVVSVIFFYKQLRQEHEWNLRKTSEENLNRLVIEDFSVLLNKLIRDFHWDISNSTQTYEEIRYSLEYPNELVDLDLTLRSIFRILETITINIKYGLIDEDICFDYLWSILINIHDKCQTFIKKERLARSENAVFENVEEYAIKWRERSKNKQNRKCKFRIYKLFNKPKISKRDRTR